MTQGVRNTALHLAQTLGLAAAVTLLAAAGPGPRVYRNEEFGITVPVPKGALLCAYPDQHDHGPVFLLATADAKRCQDEIESHRYIDIFASYQVDDETKRLDGFLKEQCIGVAGGPCRQPPRGLRVPGLRSEAARVNRSDGWLYILVVTQAGKPDPAFDPTVPSINYDMSLHTRPENLAEDLRVFRAVLRTIQLSPAP